MTRVSTPNNRKSRLRRVYSVTCVAMALVILESSRFARLVRTLSGRSICKSTKLMAMTPIAAAGSMTRATDNSAAIIRSDWRPPDRFPTTDAVAALFIPRSCWTCPSRSVDWRDQLDWKNPVTTCVRVAVSACSETDVLRRVTKTAGAEEEHQSHDRNDDRVCDEKEGPTGGWIRCLPWTPATTTSEMTNKRTAWLRAPTMARKVKATIFRRSEPQVERSHHRDDGDRSVRFSVLGGRVLEKRRFFTGPFSGPGADPCAKRLVGDSVLGHDAHRHGVPADSLGCLSHLPHFPCAPRCRVSPRPRRPLPIPVERPAPGPLRRLKTTPASAPVVLAPLIRPNRTPLFYVQVSQRSPREAPIPRTWRRVGRAQRRADGPTEH